MRVSSEEGKGTTFKLFLPVEEETPIQGPQVQERKPVRTGRGRVMVVDDEEVVRELAQDMLEQLGYDVVALQNGEEAVEYYKKTLDIDKNDIDAKKNLEFVTVMIEQMQQEQEKQSGDSEEEQEKQEGEEGEKSDEQSESQKKSDSDQEEQESEDQESEDSEEEGEESEEESDESKSDEEAQEEEDKE